MSSCMRDFLFGICILTVSERRSRIDMIDLVFCFFFCFFIGDSLEDQIAIDVKNNKLTIDFYLFSEVLDLKKGEDDERKIVFVGEKKKKCA